MASEAGMSRTTIVFAGLRECGREGWPLVSEGKTGCGLALLEVRKEGCNDGSVWANVSSFSFSTDHDCAVRVPFSFDSSLRLLMRSSECFSRSIYLNQRNVKQLLFAFHDLCCVVAVFDDAGITVKDTEHMLHPNHIGNNFYIFVAPINETLRLSQEILYLLSFSIVKLTHLCETT